MPELELAPKVETSEIDKVSGNKIIFSREWHPFQRPIRIFTGTNGGNESFSDVLKQLKSDGIEPKSYFVKKLLAEKLPKKYTIKSKSDIYNIIPSDKLNKKNPFSLVNKINNASLALPDHFFLPMPGNNSQERDVVLSEAGLSSFLRHYSQIRNVNFVLCMDMDDINKKTNEAYELSQEKPTLFLAYFEPSKRHATGIYIVKESRQTVAYFFDTTGLTLPAEPCGLRSYSGTENMGIQKVMSAFVIKGVSCAVMPINTILSIQQDYYSCFMTTILFFEGMLDNRYQMVVALVSQNVSAILLSRLSMDN